MPTAGLEVIRNMQNSGRFHLGWAVGTSRSASCQCHGVRFLQTRARVIFFLLAMLPQLVLGQSESPSGSDENVTLNQTADGFRGIWYMNQPLESEYRYKYSGGLGTYCAKHRPFAIYAPSVDRTFFCFGGARRDNSQALLHMVSYFDHQTGKLARPTILLDKHTGDAHDNPVLSMDPEGYLWVFSTSHGRSRPSYIHRSRKPYDTSSFELIPATRINESGDAVPITNFSYMQIWHPESEGFLAFFTRYGYPADRTLCFMNSRDGVSWSSWQRLAAIEKGHYQISGVGEGRIATMFNMHPDGKGLNFRTNLYYIESRDQGATWNTVDGRPLEIPLTTRANPALVHDYASESRLVYLKDLKFDQQDRPVLLYLLSQGFQAGPQDPPRQWMLRKWDGKRWQTFPITTSDNNYDFGELWLQDEQHWWLIAPTGTGPQPYNPGGEVCAWLSQDQGESWELTTLMTRDSQYNHTYVRTVVGAHPDFVTIWADGHGRKPSESRLYFSNVRGEVFRMPESMGDQDFVLPERIPVSEPDR